MVLKILDLFSIPSACVTVFNNEGGYKSYYGINCNANKYILTTDFEKRKKLFLSISGVNTDSIRVF